MIVSVPDLCILFLLPINYSLFLKLCTHDQDLRIRKFCIYANFAYVSKIFFLLCVHMAFKNQQNLSRKLKFYSIKVIVIFLNSGHA